MRKIADYGNGVEIWEVLQPWGVDFYVYGGYASGDPRVCPSLGMAREVAAGARAR